MDSNNELDERVSVPPGYVSVPLAGITQPGVYVTERGDMLRIASEFMAAGRSSTPLRESFRRVTRLSEDPLQSVSECRRVAAEADVPFNF